MGLSRDPNLLHPDVRELHDAFLKECEARGLKIITTSTHRPKEQQDDLYASGRTKEGRIVTYAKGGQSPHNYELEDGTPASLAFDIVPQVKGSLVWGTVGVDYALWEYVGAIGIEVGLEWGGSWTGRKKDRPHFQLENSRDMLKERFPEAWS